MRAEPPCYWLVYDGQCPICRRFADAVRRLDGARRILLLDLHTRGGQVQRRAPHVRQEDLLEAVHLIAPDGRVRVGFDAIRMITRLVPAFWLLSPWLHIPGASCFGPRVYRFVSRHRHWLAEPACEGGACSSASERADPC